jgi:hypothetical protein
MITHLLLGPADEFPLPGHRGVGDCHSLIYSYRYSMLQCRSHRRTRSQWIHRRGCPSLLLRLALQCRSRHSHRRGCPPVLLSLALQSRRRTLCRRKRRIAAEMHESQVSVTSTGRTIVVCRTDAGTTLLARVRAGSTTRFLRGPENAALAGDWCVSDFGGAGTSMKGGAISAPRPWRPLVKLNPLSRETFVIGYVRIAGGRAILGESIKHISAGRAGTTFFSPAPEKTTWFCHCSQAKSQVLLTPKRHLKLRGTASFMAMAPWAASSSRWSEDGPGPRSFSACGCH